VISDRNRKGDFLAVDGEDILHRVSTLPVSTWRYRDEADRSTLHIGPMAQDWHAAFGFTRDNTTINMSDFDGVNLASIQALARRTETQTAAIRALQAGNAALQADNASLREQNAQLEARLRRVEEALAARASTP
jgi:hypothetical protein